MENVFAYSIDRFGSSLPPMRMLEAICRKKVPRLGAPTTPSAPTKPWVTPPRWSSSSATANPNLKSKSVTNHVDEYNRLTAIGLRHKMRGQEICRAHRRHIPDWHYGNAGRFASEGARKAARLHRSECDSPQRGI